MECSAEHSLTVATPRDLASLKHSTAEPSATVSLTHASALQNQDDSDGHDTILGTEPKPSAEHDLMLAHVNSTSYHFDLRATSDPDEVRKWAQENPSKEAE